MYNSLKPVQRFKKRLSAFRAAAAALLTVAVVTVVVILSDRDFFSTLSGEPVKIAVIVVFFFTAFSALIFLTIWAISSMQAKHYRYDETLSLLTQRQLKTIDDQFEKFYGKLRPVMYTDEVLFLLKGLFLQAIPIRDIVWVDTYTQTFSGTNTPDQTVLRIATRERRIVKMAVPKTKFNVEALVKLLVVQRPNMLFSLSGNAGAGIGLSAEAKRLRKMYKTDFAAMVRHSDGAA